MPKYKDLTGQRFGKLLVLERDLSKTGGAAYWICQCDCGTIKSIRGGNLTTNTKPTRSCGCLAKENKKHLIDTTSLVNKKFGRLTVIERDITKGTGHGKPSYWLCQCECGNKISVIHSSLMRGHTKSCGCLHNELLSKQSTKNIAGLRSGYIEAIEKTSLHSSKGSYVWRCKCLNCGNEDVYLPIESITSQKAYSCGCLSRSIGEETIYNILKENNILFKEQYSFPDLKSKKNFALKFDFCLLNPEGNPIRLIEFDGEQHYKKSSSFYSEEGVERDKIKNEYCIKNNIPLVRIPYKFLKKLSLEMLLGDEFLI